VGEVADGCLDLRGVRFFAQARDHRLGKIDPVNPHPAARKGQGDPAGADAELERRAAAGEIGKKADDWFDNGRFGQVRVPLVEPRRHALAEVVLGHRFRILSSRRRWP